MDKERHCILLLGSCENRARCGWNCMLWGTEESGEAPKGKAPRKSPESDGRSPR